MPPATPFGPKGNFLQRIKDQSLNRIKDRIKQELAPQVNAPLDESISDAPAAPEEIDRGFWQRVKDKSTEKLRNFSPIQRRLLDPNSPLDEPTIKYRIRYAGQNNLLLFMLYNGQWRYVEPYSYRWRGTKGPDGRRALRFFGYCTVHSKIHSFNPNKIEGLVVTDQVYRPRWVVEV